MGRRGEGRKREELFKGEETDFFHRAHRDGFTMYYVPQATVRHCILPYQLEKKFFRTLHFNAGYQKAYMDSGDLVPDQLIMGIIEGRLQEHDCEKGFILDGFPRTINQAEGLKGLLKKLSIKLDFVVNLEVPRDIILNRLTTRRTCSNPACQEIYNIKNKPPTADGKCKKCGSPVIQRADETEEAITYRLETYSEKTAPLIEFYENEGLLKAFASIDSKETFLKIKKTIDAIREMSKSLQIHENNAEARS